MDTIDSVPSQCSSDLRLRLSLARSGGTDRPTAGSPIPRVLSRIREWRVRQLVEGLGSDRPPPRAGPDGACASYRLALCAPFTEQRQLGPRLSVATKIRVIPARSSGSSDQDFDGVARAGY